MQKNLNAVSLHTNHTQQKHDINGKNTESKTLPNNKCVQVELITETTRWYGNNDANAREKLKFVA